LGTGFDADSDRSATSPRGNGPTSSADPACSWIQETTTRCRLTERGLSTARRFETSVFTRFIECRTASGSRSPEIPTKPGDDDVRIDPAPRWNRDGDAILLPGLAEDGTRQLFILRIPDKRRVKVQMKALPVLGARARSRNTTGRIFPLGSRLRSKGSDAQRRVSRTV